MKKSKWHLWLTQFSEGLVCDYTVLTWLPARHLLVPVSTSHVCSSSTSFPWKGQGQDYPTGCWLKIKRQLSAYHLGSFVATRISWQHYQTSSDRENLSPADDKINELGVTNQPSVFTHRCPSAPPCAATHGPTGSVDVRSSLADHSATSGIWLWDAWGVCFHGDGHSPRPSERWAEGPAYPRP